MLGSLCATHRDPPCLNQMARQNAFYESTYLVSFYIQYVLRGSLHNDIEFENLINSRIFMEFEMFFECGILAVSVSRDPLAQCLRSSYLRTACYECRMWRCLFYRLKITNLEHTFKTDQSKLTAQSIAYAQKTDLFSLNLSFLLKL